MYLVYRKKRLFWSDKIRFDFEQMEFADIWTFSAIPLEMGSESKIKMHFLKDCKNTVKCHYLELALKVRLVDGIVDLRIFGFILFQI